MVLFHIIFLWYNFLVVPCGYYSDFWLNKELFWLSPFSTFTFCTLLFVAYFSYKALEVFRKSRKYIFIWFIALSMPVASLYGMYEFNRFMQFQRGSTPLTEFYDLDGLSEWQRIRYKLLNENYASEKDRLIKSGKYCEALDFYNRT